MYNNLKPIHNPQIINGKKNLFFKEKELVGASNKIIELFKEKNKRILELEQMALYDQLTGIYNRYGLEEKRKEYFNKNKSITIITIDIKDLGKINNAYGYTRGDKAIEDTAQIIKKYFRWKDSRKRDIIARYGGDEFTIILEKIDDGIIEKRIRQILKEVEIINKSTEYDYGIHIIYSNSGKIDDYKLTNEENHSKLKLAK